MGRKESNQTKPIWEYVGLNPRHAEYFYVLHSFPIFIQ